MSSFIVVEQDKVFIHAEIHATSAKILRYLTEYPADRYRFISPRNLLGDQRFDSLNVAERQPVKCQIFRKMAEGLLDNLHPCHCSLRGRMLSHPASWRAGFPGFSAHGPFHLPCPCNHLFSPNSWNREVLPAKLCRGWEG